MKRVTADRKAPAVKVRPSPAHRLFIYKIGMLRRLLDRYSTSALTEFGLTLAEWRVLSHLYASSPATARQLCLRVHADKAEVSRACAGLVARGHATRRADAKDRRSVLLAITPRGERLHDAIIPLRQALQNDLEVPLNAREVAELHRILDKLTNYVAQKMSREEASDLATARKDQVRTPRTGKPRRKRAKGVRHASGSRDHVSPD